MQAIQRLEEAELRLIVRLKRPTGIAGSHIRSINSTMVKIRDLEVDNSDVERVIETAQAIILPLISRSFIH